MEEIDQIYEKLLMEFQYKKKKALERNNKLQEKIEIKTALLDLHREKNDNILLEQLTLESNVCVGLISRSTTKKITQEVCLIFLTTLRKSIFSIFHLQHSFHKHNILHAVNYK